MAAITYYVALPIVRTEDGELTPGEPVEALNEWQARSRASGLAIHNPGAIAFSRTGDPSNGDFEPAVVLSRHGELPEDLEAFMAGGGEQ
jgi:hypothetical protein